MKIDSHLIACAKHNSCELKIFEIRLESILYIEDNISSKMSQDLDRESVFQQHELIGKDNRYRKI